MKVLFLDIDGVLNNSPGELQFDKIQILNGIIQQDLNIRVVISSGWKLAYQLEELQILLTEAGFLYYLYDVTPNLMGNSRWQEIELWLGLNKGVKQYCILDDGCTGYPPVEHYVEVRQNTGLQSEDTLRVLKALG